MAVVSLAAGEHVPYADVRSAWSGLLAGTWIVFDRFEDERYEYLRCRRAPERNPTAHPSKERIRLACRRAEGDTLKVIASDADRSVSSVSACISEVMRRYRLDTHVQLVTLFGRSHGDLLEPPAGLEISVTRERSHSWMSLRYPKPRWCIPAGLSVVERDIVHRVLRGDTNAQIARARGTARRTIANQLASIFRKCGVSSRVELVARLFERASAPLARKVERSRTDPHHEPTGTRERDAERTR